MNEKKTIACSFCDGESEDALVQHTYRWQGKIYVFEQVPAQVCGQCGEQYFDAKTIQEMEDIVLSSAKPTRILQVPVFSLSKLAA